MPVQISTIRGLFQRFMRHLLRSFGLGRPNEETPARRRRLPGGASITGG
ncbi:hypothetical protein QMO56_00830 [Roseomonas sp. E05]|nr:hypothetical protein [Roseomonas sp. E05]MDJ0386642.1 hypothetical protein [Roseomonas sp. E05]